MNWKHYKALSPKEKQKETFYIVGLDLGNETSGIAFYNLHENAPEPIDLSGGYGKPSIPTVMQYIPETKEWVFGEYAILNQGSGMEITIDSIVQRLGRFDYIEIDHKTVSIASILGIFIKELLGSVRNINPRAEIVGIVAAIQDQLSPEAQDELKRAFKHAGYEKELIALVPSRECVLAHHYSSFHPSINEKLLLIDYGSRGVRGGVYEIKNNAAQSDNRLEASEMGASGSKQIAVKALSNLFDEEIGNSKILADVHGLFEAQVHTATHNHSLLHEQLPSNLCQQITAFTYQHKDILFQKNIRSKPVKIYYNFVYPPFQHTIAFSDINRLINPHNDRFCRFLVSAIKKTVGADVLNPQSMDSVICTGGGFEMLWAKESVTSMFGISKFSMFKNPKLVAAEGAALVAANLLGVVAGYSFNIEDTHQLPGDIGIRLGDVFLPLSLRNAYWWQAHQPMLVLVNSKVSGELGLSISERTQSGDERILAAPTLTGLPKRPKGTTRLKFDVDFKSDTRMTLQVSDLGFGELFPASSYRQEFNVQRA